MSQCVDLTVYANFNSRVNDIENYIMIGKILLIWQSFCSLPKIWKDLKTYRTKDDLPIIFNVIFSKQLLLIAALSQRENNPTSCIWKSPKQTDILLAVILQFIVLFPKGDTFGGMLSVTLTQIVE